MKTTIAPWLSVPDAAAAVAYYVAAFDATERYRLEGEAGQVVVAQLAVGDADFWLGEDPGMAPADGGAIRMILTVDDPDAVFAQAIAAGARQIGPVDEQFGWRIGRLADPFGHHWEIGKPLT